MDEFSEGLTGPPAKEAGKVRRSNEQELEITQWVQDLILELAPKVTIESALPPQFKLNLICNLSGKSSEALNNHDPLVQEHLRDIIVLALSTMRQIKGAKDAESSSS